MLIHGQLYYISNLFLIAVLGLVKCSVSLFIATLTVNKLGSIWHAPRPQKITLGTVLLLNLAWTIASIIALAFPCKDSEVMCIGTVMTAHEPRSVEQLLTDADDPLERYLRRRRSH